MTNILAEIIDRVEEFKTKNNLTGVWVGDKTTADTLITDVKNKFIIDINIDLDKKDNKKMLNIYYTLGKTPKDYSNEGEKIIKGEEKNINKIIKKLEKKLKNLL